MVAGARENGGWRRAGSWGWRRSVKRLRGDDVRSRLASDGHGDDPAPRKLGLWRWPLR